MKFEEACDLYLLEQNRIRNGKGLHRLRGGLGPSERRFLETWWLAFGHFRYLFLEFEVRDFKEGTRYLDFAYIRGHLKACFEIDGYEIHCCNASRGQFTDNLRRQNDLQLTAEEKEIVRYAARTLGFITPIEIKQLLGAGDKYARKLLHSMVDRDILKPIGGRERVRGYELVMDLGSLLL